MKMLRALIVALAVAAPSAAHATCGGSGGFPGATYSGVQGFLQDLFTQGCASAYRTGSALAGIPKVVLSENPTINIPDFTSYFSVSTQKFGERASNYHYIYTPDAVGALQLGNASDRTNFYRNDIHAFRSAADVTFASISSSGFRIYDAAGTSNLLFAVPSGVAGTITWPSGTTDFSATGGSGQFVKQASAGGAFTVSTVAASEIASGAALTKTDDSNVTLTLGGSPTTALLAAASITVGWTGDLPFSRFVQGATNTVVANATSGTADFAAFAMPSCSTSASALNWTTNTGFGCNTSIDAATLGGATFASPGSIGSSTPGSGSFTTVTASTATGVTLSSNSSPKIKFGTTGAVAAYIDVSDNDASQLFIQANGRTLGHFTGVASGVNYYSYQSAATGGEPLIYVNSSLDTNVSMRLSSRGTGNINFFTNTQNQQQFAVLHTASATRWATVTGSNGGNPTIATTAGDLAITPGIVGASYVSVGTKIRAAGSAPAVSSCGTTPTISGSDLAGLVTTGTGTPTSCTITFNAAYSSEPYCVVHGKTQSQVTAYTVSTTALVVTTTATNNVPIEYICIGQSGG